MRSLTREEQPERHERSGTECEPRSGSRQDRAALEMMAAVCNYGCRVQLARARAAPMAARCATRLT